jgi:hypothetical protein
VKRDGGAWSLKKSSRISFPPVVASREDMNGCVGAHKKPRIQWCVDNAVANDAVAAADDDVDSGGGALILWGSAVEVVCPHGGVGGCGEHFLNQKRELHGRTLESDNGTKERMVQDTRRVQMANDDVAVVVDEGGIDGDLKKVGSSRGQRRNQT